MDAIYEVTTGKSFVETVAAVTVQTQANGFRILHIHDVQATLSEKGFEIEPLKIIEVCNAKYAHSAITIDATVSLLMPCRINVYRKGGKTVISTVRPRSLVSIFNSAELVDFANEIEEALLRIINQSV